MRVKLKANQRQRIISEAALRIGLELGIAAVNHTDVAFACRVKTSRETVKHYYPTKAALWDAAIERDDTGILARQRRSLDGK